MILSAQSIQRRVLVGAPHRRGPALAGGLVIEPFSERTVVHGMSYGLSACGYDVRIKDAVRLDPGGFALATSVEYVSLPADLMVKLADKSTWARRGIAVQNTIFEPGWRGYATIELSNHARASVAIPAGAPIAQMVFYVLDQPTDRPYAGKYQDQPQRPVAAIEEE